MLVIVGDPVAADRRPRAVGVTGSPATRVLTDRREKRLPAPGDPFPAACSPVLHSFVASSYSNSKGATAAAELIVLTDVVA
jgi:hypothetical protein